MPDPAQSVSQKFPQQALPGIVLVVVWLCFLFALTCLTANPVTLNQQQIKVSDFIARGRINPQNQDLLIDETWPVMEQMPKVKLVNLDQITADFGSEYLIPVVIIDQQYHVTPSLVKGLPLIYPVRPEAIEQLELILSGQPLQ